MSEGTNRRAGFVIAAIVSLFVVSFVATQSSLLSGPSTPTESKVSEAISALIRRSPEDDHAGVAQIAEDNLTTSNLVSTSGDIELTQEEPSSNEVDSAQEAAEPGHSEITSTKESSSGQIGSTHAGLEPKSDETNPPNAELESRSDMINPTQEASETVFRELMTPEWIERNESQMSDPLSPMHVHLLWIGDMAKAPNRIHEYSARGYALTVHTSAEEILDGFHPYVFKAYTQAVPRIVGIDFLKFALLYKYGGLVVDADTTPGISASGLKYPTECDVVFGKEAHLPKGMYAGHPKYRNDGKRDYGLNRPYQILNWAMAASKPRNEHIKKLMTMSIMHFFGQRDMNGDLIQDIAGSGLMTDYVALLHEAEGRSYPEVYENQATIPVQGICLVDNLLTRDWIHHHFLSSWKNAKER